jgi:hypothetical protein
MRDVSRRIARLERSQVPPPGEDLRRPVLDSALASMARSDLALCRDALLARRNGLPLTAEQRAADEERNRAMESVSLQAGYKSFADFNQRCPMR